MMVRMRALPSGTVGNAMPVPSTPSLKSSREKSMVSLPSPMMIGVIGVSLAGVAASADVEAQQPEFFFPEARVLPELLHALRLVFENVEGRDAGRRHRRRMRSRKQERPCAVIRETRSDRGCRRRIRRERRSLSRAFRPECRRGRACRNDRSCRVRCGPARRKRARRRPS